MTHMGEPRDFLVLNVNDDEAVRYSVSRKLRHAGYRLIEAEDGESALQLVEAERPSLVILDVKLPDMSGFEVCRRIKARYSCAVLHLSALAVDSADRVTGLEGGADGYLTQPVEPQVLLATVRSLLRLQHAESEARASSEYWQASFDAIRDGVAVVGTGLRVLRCNRAFDQLFGRAMCGERMFGADGALPEIPTEHAVQRLELTRDGRWFQVSVDPFVVYGERRGTVLVMVDVTERKLLEQALTQRAEDLADADRRKDDFLAMLAHELRNPLSAVTSALELLPETPSTQRVSDVIRRQTMHVARLIDDLLDVSRIRRGRVELKRRGMDLAVLVEQAAESVRPRMNGLGHHLTLELPGHPVRVHGDQTRLEQVLANLLDNAARYTPYGGKVTIKLSVPEPGVARLQVVDNGDGIPRAHVEKVFELFTQLNVKIDRQRGGLGIGLTLVRNLVEMHGGHVRADSDGPGRGATFTVELPLVEAEVAEPEPHVRPAAGHAVRGGQPLRILVVEDNADAREMLKDLLETWGHEVAAEMDGRAGLTRAMAEPFDACIIDIGLPLMDGYTLVRELRQRTPAGPLPFLVALTGYGSVDERQRSAQAGFDLHMVKPLDVEHLEKVLGGLDQKLSPTDSGPLRTQQRA